MINLILRKFEIKNRNKIKKIKIKKASISLRKQKKMEKKKYEKIIKGE